MNEETEGDKERQLERKNRTIEREREGVRELDEKAGLYVASGCCD